jgi:MFS family permease
MIAAADRRHIISFALITALCLTGDSMLYIALPVHYTEAGLSSLWEVGVVLAVNRMIRLPLNPCIGRFYAHADERTGILIAVLLATATTFSYAFLSSFAMWIVARCIWGVAWTLLRLGSLFCILRLSTPESRGHCMGLYNGLYRLGSLFGMLLGGIFADSAGIAFAAVFFGAATALSVFPALFAVPKGAARRERGSGTSPAAAGRAAIARGGRMLWIAAGGGIVGLVIQGTLASTLSRIISVHTEGGVAMFGFAVGASSLAGFFQALRWSWEPWLAPFIGRLSDARLGRAKTLSFAFGTGTAALLLLALALPLPLWFCCLLFMQLAATALTTTADAAASDAAASGGGHSFLVGYALIMDAGAALGPLLAYAANEFLGIDAAYALCSMLFLPFFLYWRRRSLESASRRA